MLEKDRYEGDSAIILKLFKILSKLPAIIHSNFLIVNWKEGRKNLPLPEYFTFHLHRYW